MLRLENLQEPPSELRAAYLHSLAEPQELYLEMHVEAGKTWLLDDFGYAVVCENRLVELYVTPPLAHRVVDLFNAVMSTSGASTVLAKSYDAQMLYAAFSAKATVTTRGLLFRRIADNSFLPRDDVAFRPGTNADAEAIYAFNDDFFGSLEEIQQYASIGGLFILERNGEAVGCGIGKPVIDNRPDIDIGMLVSKLHRSQGYGSHIIAYLKAYYLGQGMRPICGCSVENIGSQKALTNAGFLSEHRLLEISY